MHRLFTTVCILMSILAGGCDIDDVATAPAGTALKVVSTVDLSGVPEPSGLALDNDGIHFWTVSDQTGNLYRLAANGVVVATYELNGEDLEGVAVDPRDGSLLVVEERAGTVIHLNRNGQEIERWTPSGLPDMANSGLEGVVVEPQTGHIFLLKEKSPGLLIEMNRQGAVVASHELDFASDFSGLCLAADQRSLIVLSDQSASATWCDFWGQPTRTLATGLDKGEGLTINPSGTRIFAVSDRLSTLTTFELPVFDPVTKHARER